MLSSQPLLPPTMEFIKSHISLPTVHTSTPAPFYHIIGKPGSGKSTLAVKLANHFKRELISPNLLVEGFKNKLLNGGSISVTETEDIYKAALKKSNNRFKGVVVDGVTIPAQQLGYRCIFIRLEITDIDVKRRRTAERVDPQNGTLYPGAQIAYSRASHLKRKATQKENDAEEEEADAGSLKEEEHDDEDGNEEEVLVEDRSVDFMNEDTEPTVMETKKKPILMEPKVRLVGKGTWEVIPEEVLDRLLQRPENDPKLIDDELKQWEKTSPLIEKYESMHDPRITSTTTPVFLNIDSTQHPDVVFKEVLHRLDVLNQGPTNPRTIPTPLPPLDITGKSEDEILAYYSTCNLEKDETPRKYSHWRKFCPVSFKLDLALVQSNTPYVVAYEEELYFLANELYGKKFEEFPDEFLDVAPKPTGIKICVLGDIHGSKSTQAKYLSELYDLKYVNVGEILDEWLKRVDQGPLMKGLPLYKNIKERLRAGRTLTTVQVVKVIRHTLQEKNLKPKQGWVLDGYPQNDKQATALVGAGLVPDYGILIERDASTESTQNQMYFLQKPISSKTGLAMPIDAVPVWSQPRKLPGEKKYPSTWCPELPIQEFPFAHEMENARKEDRNTAAKTLEKAGVIVSTFSELSYLQLLSRIMNVVDPFIFKAVSKIIPEGSSPSLGLTKDYCPVALSNKNRLVKGLPSLSVEYMNKIYYMADDASKSLFLAEPQNFASSQRKLSAPPPRIVVVGPSGSGKTSICKEIAKWCGARHFEWTQLLTKMMEKMPTEEKKEGSEEAQTSFGVEKEIPKSMYLDCLQPLYDETSGFIIEGFPTKSGLVESLLAANIQVDVVVHIKVGSDVLAGRIEIQRGKLGIMKRVDQAKKEEEEEEEDTLEEIVDKENNQVQELVTSFESSSTIPIVEVDGNKCLRRVFAYLKDRIGIFTLNRKSIFTVATPITSLESVDFLNSGRKKYSPFSKLCPISIQEQKCVTRSCLGLYPVTINDNIYFLQSSALRKKFINHPTKYVNRPSPPPILCPKVCVVGRPKSGKTFVAKRLAAEFNAVYLTVPIIVESILDGNESTELCNQIKKALKIGKTIPKELVTGAIRTITQRGLCQVKGWILDGYPNTLEQAASLDAAGIFPTRILHLNIVERDTIERCKQDGKSPGIIKDLTDILSIVEGHSKNFERDVKMTKEFFEAKYDNWVTIQAADSKWKMVRNAREEVEICISNMQTHSKLLSLGMAAPAFKINIRVEKMKKNLSLFGDYCVVSFVDDYELIRVKAPSQYIAEYKNKYYNMADAKKLETFLSSPEKYSQAHAPTVFPVMRPNADLKALFPRSISLKGYCPVTLFEGNSSLESLVEGSPEFMVDYNNNLYLMANSIQNEKFMRTPFKYDHGVLPPNLPAKKIYIPLSQLPITAYLEETIISQLNSALNAVGKFRPRYPFRSLDASACDFLGLYLQAHNREAKTWIQKRRQEKLEKYQEKCDLIRYLSQKMRERAFIPPNQEQEYETKMNAFLGLRNSLPS